MKDCIQILSVMCDIFKLELNLIKQDLVQSGNGDMITLDIITGAEIKDFRIVNNELYVTFENNDILKGEIK